MSHIDDAKEWNTLNERLKEALRKEVNIMRELLANMHQEELSLLLNDQGSLHELLDLRSSIMDRLSALRADRIEIADKIEKIAASHSRSFQEITPDIDEDTCTQILSLKDQLIALTEQMNRQRSQNQYLIDHPDHTQILAAQSAPRAKKKASVATYQIKK